MRKKVNTESIGDSGILYDFSVRSIETVPEPGTTAMMTAAIMLAICRSRPLTMRLWWKGLHR
jgi:hypothetical protein